MPGEGHDGVALLTAADEGRRNRRTYDAVLPHVDVLDRPPYNAISTVAIGALVAAGFRKKAASPRRHVRWEDFGPR